jgi:ParB family chromosome partitioning protein
VNQPPKNPRLGRGLAALLGDSPGARNAIDAQPGAETAPAAGPVPSPTDIPVEAVQPNPRQPRRTFVEADLLELTESIRRKGVLQPILVRPSPGTPGRFEIVAGERRWRAARRAGLSALPAIIREMDDREVLEVGIIENVQRADLNPMEEAEAYRSLIERFGRTQESVAQQVGKSREHVSNTMRLLNLPDSIREHVRSGALSAGHGRALLKCDNAESLAAEAIRRNLSVRELEALARDNRTGQGTARPVAEKDVDTRALEHDLERSLGLKVDIRHSEKGGEVRIRYVKLEQLDEICRLLSRPRIVLAAREAASVDSPTPEPEAAPPVLQAPEAAGISAGDADAASSIDGHAEG